MTDIIFNAGTTLDNQTITIAAGDRLIFGPSTDAVLLGDSTITGDGTFINEGSLSAPDSGLNTLSIDTDFTNYGTITGLDHLILDHFVANFGTINLVSGSSIGQVDLHYDTNTTGFLADLAKIRATISYSGTLDNNGQTLDLGALGTLAQASISALSGTLDGGVLVSAGFSNFSNAPFDMVLNGVTVGHLLEITSVLEVENGLTFQSSPQYSFLSVDGGGGLYFRGTQILNPGSYYDGVTFTNVQGSNLAATLGGDDLTLDGQFLLETNMLVTGGTIENAGQMDQIFVASVPTAQKTIHLTTDQFFNSGEISLSDGALQLDGSLFDNTGTIFLDQGSTIEVQNGSATLGYMYLADSSGETIQDDIASAGSGTPLTGTLSDFGGTDRIIFPKLLYSDGDTIDYANGTLTITDDGTTIANLAVQGAYAPGFFHIQEAYPGGFGIEVVACYARNTMILTPEGEVPVEALRIGDCITTRSGEARPIKWIGRRSYDGRFVAGRREMLPVRFRAGSLGAGIPHRDLLVSPHHAMFLDGVLVPAELLINGVSVVQETDVETVEYFHVELDTHDVLVAEGAASESFVDCDSRAMFHNAPEFEALYPGDRAAPWQFCAPRVESGAALQAIRQEIDRRAGIDDRSGRLLGQIDEVGAARITGWACDATRAGLPLLLRVEIDGEKTALVLAARHRADLEASGHGPGRCGFEIGLPTRTGRAHLVRILRQVDGTELEGSPVLVPALSATHGVSGGPEALPHLLREASRLAASAVQRSALTAGMAR